MGTERNNKYPFLLVLLFFWLVSLGASQNKLSLKESGILKEVQVVKSILQDNANSSNTLAGEIAYLEYQVLAARKIIRLIDDQVEVSNGELTKLHQQLSILESEHREAIEHFQAILLEEYKNRDYKKKLYFLASSKNISEFVNRLNHLNTLKDFRMKHLIAIDNKKKEVLDKLAVYSGSKAQKKNIVASKTTYITQLNEVLRKKHQKYTQLENENQTLKLHLKEQNECLERLNTEVKEVVHNEKVSNQTQNLNKLPWPISSGLVVGRFGVHKHAKERKVKVANNGIDILVAPKEEVVAVADGDVKAIMELPGQNMTVILNHGSFCSVYSNIKDVTIKIGDRVRVAQRFANVARNNDNMSKLHFELWKGTVKVDPEKYMNGPLN